MFLKLYLCLFVIVFVCNCQSLKIQNENIESAVKTRSKSSKQNNYSKFRADMIDDVMLNEISSFGVNQSSYLYDLEEERIYKSGTILDQSDAAHFLGVFTKQSTQAKELAKYGYASLQATVHLAAHQELSRKELAYGLDTIQLKASEKFPNCPFNDKMKAECEAAGQVFRSADGSCNNLEHPEWGSSLMPHLRFLPAAYGDGIQSFRKSESGNSLPSPRLVSSFVHRESGVDTPLLTMMVMQWGQFLSHDVSFTPMSRGFNKSMIKCCTKDGHQLDDDIRHPECSPIEILKTDQFYAEHNVSCMEFVRSSPSPRAECSLGPREQINQATSYLDASSVYGSTARDQFALRKNDSGLLAFTEFGVRKPLLPPLDRTTFKGECKVSKPKIHCFAAGDSRVNEVPGLTSMHTLWMREHNRLAKKLAQINPGWDDERLFQESRKIVGALNQHITYNEWLPVTLGETVLNIFYLRLKQSGYQQDYNSSINPTFSNAVGVAAFRFGHSQIRNSLSRCTKDFKELPITVKLHKELNDPTNIYNPGSIDRIVMGLATKTMFQTDEYMAEEVTNHLFQTPERKYGMDLAAINIQRGRDHGIPSYHHWRKACGLSPLKSWSDMVSAATPETVERLSKIYEHVRDVDLFTGGLSEKHVPGGVVGPTFACLLGQQFLNLKRGDRFWYENGNHPGAFTPEQLMEIRKSSLARIICDNLDSVDSLQPYVFISFEESSNKPQACRGSSIPSINLEKWREASSEDGLTSSTDENAPAFYSNIFDVLQAKEQASSREELVADDLPQQISRSQYYDFFNSN